MLAYFICPFNRRNLDGEPSRYCAMDDFTPQIFADGGTWRASECLGNSAVAKVRASAATLQTINAAPGFLGIPGSRLDDPLATLTAAQKTAIRNKLLGGSPVVGVASPGYTLAELNAAFPNDLSTYVVGDVLRFALRRRLASRYDQATDTIILDGAGEPILPVEHIDAAVN